MNACNPEIGREAADPFVLWGRILLDDPGTGLDDLLSGRGARGAQQRADPEDFLADLLAHPAWRDERARLIDGLDEALLDWIVERFRWSPADVDAFGARAYAAQLSDSLKIAARLPLDETVRAMTRDHVTWDDRFRGLRCPATSICRGTSTWYCLGINLTTVSSLVGLRFAMRLPGAPPTGAPI